MSEQFDREDYSEYFAALERQIVTGAEKKKKKKIPLNFPQKDRLINRESIKNA